MIYYILNRDRDYYSSICNRWGQLFASCITCICMHNPYSSRSHDDVTSWFPSEITVHWFQFCNSLAVSSASHFFNSIAFRAAPRQRTSDRWIWYVCGRSRDLQSEKKGSNARHHRRRRPIATASSGETSSESEINWGRVERAICHCRRGAVNMLPVAHVEYSARQCRHQHSQPHSAGSSMTRFELVDSMVWVVRLVARESGRHLPCVWCRAEREC